MIKVLPKAQHQKEALRFRYNTGSHYGISIQNTKNTRRFHLSKKPLPAVVEKTFVGYLYASHCEAPEAYGYFEKAQRVGVIEMDYLAYGKRVRITELLVDETVRKKGIGKALMAFVERRALALGARAMVLETQSCNVDAIAFYEACGFSIIGFDLMAYSNDDVQKREFRIEMGKRLD